MFVVYVLYSRNYDKIYIGQTADLENRMLWHNERSFKGYTTKFRPWEVAYTESFNTRREAMKREKYLKSSRGRKYVWRKFIPPFIQDS